MQVETLNDRLKRGGYWETARALEDSNALTGFLLRGFEPYSVVFIREQTVVFLKHWVPLRNVVDSNDEKKS